MRHLPRHALVHANRAQYGIHLALHLTITRALHARFSRAAEVAVVVALRLGCEETADSHGNGTSDKFGDAAEDDELGLAEGRETCGEGERDGEAVRKANDTN